MDLNHFYGVTVPKETSFGTVRFTPINVDFWVRLFDWHEKTFGEVQRVLGQQTRNTRLEEARLLETLTCLVHTATYPHVQASVSSDAWKDACFNWVLTDPGMVEWFLKYLEQFLPTDSASGRVQHPRQPEPQSREFSWDFLNDVSLYTGLSPEEVRSHSLKALFDLMEKAHELEKLRMELQAKTKLM